MTRLDVVDLLRERQGKKSLRAFAEKIGVSAAYLSDVYRGNREPGPTVLALLGIERTKTVQIAYMKK
jgi:transcriptional regulator with XRE-family HTH domain